MTLTKLSLFSGILGDDLASEWAGIKTICCVEIDPFCQKVIKKHYPNMPIIGERLGLQGERSTLWQEYLRIICEIKPNWIVAENVVGLLSVNNGRFFGGILRDLSRSGYNAEWRVLRASWFGIPQNRERVFIVAYPARISPPQIFHKNTIYVTSHTTRMDEQSRNSPDIDYQDYRTCAMPLLGDYVRRTIPDRERSGTDDGIPDRLDRHHALGNSCVPQQVYPIYKTIVEVENAKNAITA